MKRVFIQLALGALLLIVGFVGGRLFQHFKSGYHYAVRAEKEYESPLGLVKWSYVTESIGLPFLDPGTTIIKLEDRTIYKAQRGFQESVPYAQNITATENTIAWDDGEFEFHLVIEKRPEQ